MIYCFLTEQDEMPSNEYIGQKLTILVKINTPPNSNKTIPKVPVITFVKYRIEITAAIKSLTILSAEPMLFFILCRLKLSLNILQI